uniref:Sperm flagellar 2 n=1 Tax=Salarias fasciatus TaxID=181472 RepID=A0A672IYT4_SALFA
MSEILCRWLNQELQLSRVVEPKTLARDFSNGYLIGEVLHKYQLQSDFSLTSISKVNNFTRLEPTLKLLGISFNINTAQDLMQEKQGAATHLLYQLYDSLEKKKKAELSGTMMEIMQPAAIAKLHKKEHEIYSDFFFFSKVKKKALMELLFYLSLYYWFVVGNLAFCHNVICNLHLFSSSGHPFPPNDPFGGSSQGCEVPGGETKLILQSNSKYLQEIRQRLEENAVACEQRQKRCDRFLVEQLKAHEAQEEARRDEQLVKRLTRQTRQEQRLAAQLLQIRMQKEVIVKNRLFREQQYQQRREKDFQEALDREAALAQQAKLERAEEIRMELEFCQRMAAERAQGRYKKHFNICKDILEQIVDLATKMGEYRLLTGNLIPEKQMREWKELLFSGLPLYEPETDHQCDTSAPLDPVELNKQEILNNMDYDEYTDMVGEWAWREEAEEMNLPLTNNNILGHVVHRLRSILHPPTIETSPPLFPPFTIKACALGRLCAAQTACLSKTAEGITRVPAQSGWILIGYPLDVTQAHLLEKALGGSVDLGSGVVDNRTNLAADPNPPKPPPPTAPVLDVALLLDIPDAQVITQAVSQMGMPCQTYSGPCFQCLTCFSFSRTIDFRDTWPELEEWFGKKQDILVRVDADVKDEELCSRIHSVLQQVMQKKNKDVEKLPFLKFISICLFYSHNLLKIFDFFLSSAPPTPPAEDAVPENVETPGSSLTASAPVGQSLKEKNVQSVTSLSTTNPHSPKGNYFIKLSEIPKLLCPYWDAVCESYVNNVKRVMEQLRSQQTLINNHLFNFRYSHYLDRPDLKQEIVSHWQKDFNSFQDDLRQDEDTKAELHLRLDELRERLWDISDKRKEENEQEKASLLCDDWLEDQSTCLINHHCVLMQVELNRFQETLCLLRVYYLGMCSQTPPELPSNFVYIPLIDSRGATDQDERQDALKGISKVIVLVKQNRGIVIDLWIICSYYLQSLIQLYCLNTAALLFISVYLFEIHAQHGFNSCVFLLLCICVHASLFSLENAAKARIALVKSHGLVMVESLQCRAQECFSAMDEWLQARYLAEMKRWDILFVLVNVCFGGILRDMKLYMCVYMYTLCKHFFSCSQLMEIVSSLTNDRNLVDWRRFLLSAALPWPFPSVTQLLDALKHFKEADTEHTGYINEVQYSQTELWFSTENIQTVSEEPSEIVPHDRLADLPKFIFRLFADHTSAPPQLDYVSMLQYFAADSNPRQGFIRALSVVLGQQIKHSSLSHLVKRFIFADPQNLTQIFRELGYDSEGGVPFSILSQHPFIQALMEESTQYQLVVSPILLFISF